MEKDTFTKKLGLHIAEIRESQNITQLELGKRCNKQQQNISRLEAGGMNPSAYYIYELSKALKVPMSNLLDF